MKSATVCSSPVDGNALWLVSSAPVNRTEMLFGILCPGCLGATDENLLFGTECCVAAARETEQKLLRYSLPRMPHATDRKSLFGTERCVDADDQGRRPVENLAHL